MRRRMAEGESRQLVGPLLCEGVVNSKFILCAGSVKFKAIQTARAPKNSFDLRNQYERGAKGSGPQ
jgi:hypothetical protein